MSGQAFFCLSAKIRDTIREILSIRFSAREAPGSARGTPDSRNLSYSWSKASIKRLRARPEELRIRVIFRIHGQRLLSRETPGLARGTRDSRNPLGFNGF